MLNMYMHTLFLIEKCVCMATPACLNSYAIAGLMKCVQGSAEVTGQAYIHTYIAHR